MFGQQYSAVNSESTVFNLLLCRASIGQWTIPNVYTDSVLQKGLFYNHHLLHSVYINGAKDYLQYNGYPNYVTHGLFGTQAPLNAQQTS